MKIILQKNSRYLAIDCNTSRWSDQGHLTIEDAINNIQNGLFSNDLIINCTSEKELLKVLKRFYSSYKLITCIHKDIPYEYW